MLIINISHGSLWFFKIKVSGADILILHNLNKSYSSPVLNQLEGCSLVVYHRSPLNLLDNNSVLYWWFWIINFIQTSHTTSIVSVTKVKHRLFFVVCYVYISVNNCVPAMCHGQEIAVNFQLGLSFITISIVFYTWVDHQIKPINNKFVLSYLLKDHCYAILELMHTIINLLLLNRLIKVFPK